MKQPINYIATWFYKESKDDASFYPQLGQKGCSALVHSVYMQIQVPFFTTFRYYNPQAHLLFFTNLRKADLPNFLTDLFLRLHVEVITLPYTCRPPKHWYAAWQNQFYLYDILKEMGKRMTGQDTLLISDADCLCRTSLNGLFNRTREDGSALYEFITDRQYSINGITLPQMEAFYRACYKEDIKQPLTYYGGEFITLRGDTVNRINEAYPSLWQFNLEYGKEHTYKLNEEAHVLSILAAHLQLRNTTANQYVKRMWTSPQFNNVAPGDENYPVWHLPYEKKRGLYRLYKLLSKEQKIKDESKFWGKASLYNGIPTIGFPKKINDFILSLIQKKRQLFNQS